jgi:hypothetical protein
VQEIDVGALVIIHCRDPREKMWGVLLRLDAVGLVLRGLGLDTVEDWLRQERSGGGGLIAPSTCFIPTHRIARVDLDESGTAVASFGDRFAEACGRDVREALMGDRR